MSAAIRHVLDLRDASHPLLIDPSAFCVVLGVTSLLGAGLRTEADRVLDDHVRTFSLTDAERAALIDLARASIDATRLRPESRR